MAVLIVTVIVLLVYLFDINYFVRVPLTLLNGVFNKRPIKFTDESSIFGRVLPFDADFQLAHMSDARILREYDFGKIDFHARSGFAKELIPAQIFTLKPKPIFSIASTMINIRPLHMFRKYKVVTKVVYWKDNIVYHEQKMITLSDGITRNIGYSKFSVPLNVDDFVSKFHPDVVKPKITKDLKLWIAFNEENALKSRQTKAKEIVGNREE